MKFIDISIPIKEKMLVYPGDPTPIISKVKERGVNSEYDISKIDFCLHAGTHIDTPSHIIPGGASIGEVPLEKYCGTAKVFDMGNLKTIHADDIEDLDIVKGDRVLFKTSNSKLMNEGTFSKDYVSLDLSAARFLSSMNINLVGIDFLSVESFYSKDFSVHKTLLASGIIILEGLNLSKVSAGEYFLSAAPINVYVSEGAPVRAVLINFK